jgi:hypothetical protein
MSFIGGLRWFVVGGEDELEGTAVDCALVFLHSGRVDSLLMRREESSLGGGLDDVCRLSMARSSRGGDEVSSSSRLENLLGLTRRMLRRRRHKRPTQVGGGYS